MGSAGGEGREAGVCGGERRWGVYTFLNIHSYIGMWGRGMVVRRPRSSETLSLPESSCRVHLRQQPMPVPNLESAHCAPES